MSAALYRIVRIAASVTDVKMIWIATQRYVAAMKRPTLA
jgi:hypothetical protein